MRFLLSVSILCGGAISVFMSRAAPAAEYFVAPSGNDINDGSIGSPFGSFTQAISLVMPGDTIFARGGTYMLGSRVTVNSSRAGTKQNPINFLAYPGETPILDFSGMSDELLGQSMGRGLQINEGANWWRVKGLTIQNAKDNGLYNGGSNSIFERIVTRWNADSGFQLHDTAANNLVLNSDSYENYDPHNRGENADGFAVKHPMIGPGNIFRGNRAWRNSDDGWDMFAARANGVLIESSWAYDNGYDPDPENKESFNGDGNGFKLGHDSGSHVLVRVAAWSNPVHGIDVNGNGYIYDGNEAIMPNGNKVQVLNSTSYNNGGKNWLFDEALPHTLRNNISHAGNYFFELGVQQQLNTWNNIPVDDDDFLSLDDAIARGSRRSDGSLPLSPFLRLAEDSNLIDVGSSILYAFNGVTYRVAFTGSSPDLGAFEFQQISFGVPGDYNGDNIVDAADYTVWRNTLGQTGPNLPADGNGDETVDEDDYALWKENFGMTAGGGSLAAASVAVPEPASGLLFTISLLAAAACRARPRTSR